MAKSIEERIIADIERARKLDPAMWRHPLAEATVRLLERGEAVTIETLTAELKLPGDSADVLLKNEISKAAIERLSQIVVQKD